MYNRTVAVLFAACKHIKGDVQSVLLLPYLLCRTATLNYRWDWHLTNYQMCTDLYCAFDALLRKQLRVNFFENCRLIRLLCKTVCIRFCIYENFCVRAEFIYAISHVTGHCYLWNWDSVSRWCELVVTIVVTVVVSNPSNYGQITYTWIC